jgi:hypothetical protein
MKRNAEGSEDTEEDAEEVGKRFFHRQGAKEERFTDLKAEVLVCPWLLGGDGSSVVS